VVRVLLSRENNVENFLSVLHKRETLYAGSLKEFEGAESACDKHGKGRKCSASIRTEQVVGATREKTTRSSRKYFLVSEIIQVELRFIGELCDIRGTRTLLQ
jgi:hypothetical protein